jgi:hypothetical protein
MIFFKLTIDLNKIAIIPGIVIYNINFMEWIRFIKQQVNYKG